MFDLNLQYINQAEREGRIEADLRRRRILQAVEATASSDKPGRARTTERRQSVGPVRAFGR